MRRQPASSRPAATAGAVLVVVALGLCVASRRALGLRFLSAAVPSDLWERYFDNLATLLRVGALGVSAAGVAAIVWRKKIAANAAAWWGTWRDGRRGLFRDFGRIVRAEVRGGGWIIYLSCMFAGLGLRLLFVSQPMRYDEALTYMGYVNNSLVKLVVYSAPNNHVLHTFLVKLSTALFGGVPWAIRLPALIAGVTLIPSVGLLARYVFGCKSALLPMALTAMSPYLVLYSTNGRGYTLLALLFVLMVLSAAHMLKTSNAFSGVMTGVFGALGLFTVPTALLGAGAVYLWCLLEAWQRREDRWRRVVVSASSGATLSVATYLLYFPVFFFSGADSLFNNRFVLPLPVGTLLSELPGHCFETLGLFVRDLPLVVVLILVAAVLVGCIALASRRESAGRLLVAAFIAGVVTVFAKRVVPFPRNWIYWLPLLAAVAGRGVDCVLEQQAGKLRTPIEIGVTLLLFASVARVIIHTHPIPMYPDTGRCVSAPALAEFFQSHLKPGESIVAFSPAEMPLLYHLQRLGMVDGLVDETHKKGSWLVFTPDFGKWGQVEDAAGIKRKELERVKTFRDAEVYRVPR